MITRKVIEALYKKYRKLPESTDCLDMPLLFECYDNHAIKIDMEGTVDLLVIGSIDPSSPFHHIPLERIHAVVPFEEWVAIVLHSSIIFLNRKTTKVSVHIRSEAPSLWERFKNMFGRW